MVRAGLLVSIVSACAACRPAAPVDIGHVGSTSVVPHDRAPPRRSASSPLGTLTARVHAKVTVESTLAVPGGKVLVYTYGRLESRIGERTAAGHDVAAELAAEQQHCEDERAALDPVDREQLEADDQRCEVIAGAALFADEQLTPECRALGVAYFDAGGRLLGDLEIGGPCLRRVASLEPYDLTPEPTDELLLTAWFETTGELGQGGWGVTEETTRLVVLGLSPNAEERLVQQLDLELDLTRDAGVCTGGTHRSLRVADPGVIEVYAQDWSDCPDEGCVDADEAAGMLEDEDAEPMPVCERAPVTAAVARWSPEGKAWSVLEPVPYEGTVLPDGIMR